MLKKSANNRARTFDENTIGRSTRTSAMVMLSCAEVPQITGRARVTTVHARVDRAAVGQAERRCRRLRHADRARVIRTRLMTDGRRQLQSPRRVERSGELEVPRRSLLQSRRIRIVREALREVAQHRVARTGRNGPLAAGALAHRALDGLVSRVAAGVHHGAVDREVGGLAGRHPVQGQVAIVRRAADAVHADVDKWECHRVGRDRPRAW